jgi:hypothetical protein
MSTEPYPAISGAPALGYANTAAVTPDDDNDLNDTTRALYIGGAGNVTIIDANGNTTTFEAVPVGMILPVRASRVMATGTTATNIVALW